MLQTNILNPHTKSSTLNERPNRGKQELIDISSIGLVLSLFTSFADEIVMFIAYMNGTVTNKVVPNG